jgi:predicted DNA-binding ArsR family transcriptional regulator
LYPYKKSNEPEVETSVFDLSKVVINKEQFKHVGIASQSTICQIDGQTCIFYSFPPWSLKLKGFPLPSQLELVDPMQGAADILEMALFSYGGYEKYLKRLSITEAMEEHLNEIWDVVEAANFEAE